MGNKQSQWLFIHFPPNFDTISLKEKVIWLSFLKIQNRSSFLATYSMNSMYLTPTN